MPWPTSNKRSGKNGAERFTGLYKAADGTYKSAGTCDTEVRALEVAEAAERHARLQLAETSPAGKATVTLATYMEMFLSTADIEANSKETYARHLTLHVIPYIGKQQVAEVSGRRSTACSRNRARPGDLPGATVRLDRGRRPGPAHPRADRCPGLHR